MRTAQSPKHKPVGLYVSEVIDQLAADIANVRGKSKSAVYCDGIRALAKELSTEEKTAVSAIRAARGSR